MGPLHYPVALREQIDAINNHKHLSGRYLFEEALGKALHLGGGSN